MSSQDSVIVLSKDDEEATEKYLKIHYPNSKEFLDVPLENNKSVLSKDIIYMDSRIYALIIQMHGSKRMVKLKENYVKEPKEKWRNVKVYAVLKEDCEMKWNKFRSAEISYPDVTDNWNTRIKSETPAMLTEEIQNKNQRRVTRSMTLSSNGRNTHNQVKVEAREMSTTVPRTNHKVNLTVPSSTVARHSDNSSEDESAVTDDDGSNSDAEESLSDDDVKAVVKEFCPDKEITESVNRITVIDEPSDHQLFMAYKVSSLKELEAKLCRGNTMYHGAFEICVRRFKRTMIIYPNNEFVRLVHWAKRTNMIMKDLDPSANDVCVLCDEDFTFKHLVCQKHADMYRQKFNSDPPEIALILNPKIYKQYLDSSVLADLKILEFKNLEEAPEFLTTGNNLELTILKYILFNRLLQGTLVMNMNNFVLEKILFLRENLDHASLQKIFKTKDFQCYGCNKIALKNAHNYLQHILTDRHIKNCLNQEEWNNICKALSFIEKTSYGFCFQPKISRKRKQSSNNVQNRIKRRKNS